MKFSFNILVDAWENVLDLILPRKCAGCEADKQAFCDNCIKKSQKSGAQCLFCGFRNQNGAFCRECPKKSDFLSEVGPALPAGRLRSRFRQAIWAGNYRDELKSAILELKYKKRRELAEPLGNMLFLKFKEIFPVFPKDSFIIIPIPLHYIRFKERGFNQAEALGNVFSKFSGIDIVKDVIEKIKETEVQAKIPNRDLRLKNLEKSFLAYREKFAPFKNKTVILIDDVSTTGSTLFYASQALATAGAKKIIGLVVAHG